MHILITGGAGFIGSHLVDALIAQQNKLIVIDSLISGNRENLKPHLDTGACQFIQGDIRDKKTMDSLPSVEMVYHFAADPDVRTSVPNPMVSYDHNMTGTMNVLEYCRNHEIKYLVFASSGGTVYGESEIFPLREPFPLHPISPYGASKAAAEMYLSAYAFSYSMKIASVRFANIFGERSQHGVGYDFYMKLRENPKQLTILWDGLQQKSYLHVADAVRGVLLVGQSLLMQRTPYEVYNIGAEDWYTVIEIAEIYEQQLNLTKVQHTFTGGDRGWVGDVAKSLLAIDKLKQLGFSPQISFREGVHRYCQWLDKQHVKKKVK